MTNETQVTDLKRDPADDHELEKYRIRYSLYNVVFGTAIVGLAGVLIPGAIEYWKLFFDDRRKAVEIQLAQVNHQQAYVKDFLDTALNQDIELRIRFADYFAHVAADPSKDDWTAFRDSLVLVRDRNRKEIHVKEVAIRQALAEERPDVETQASIAQLERELEWLYKEVGYVPKDRSVVRSKSEKADIFSSSIAAAKARLWKGDSIPVCWESGEDAPGASPELMKVVRASIDETWGQHSRLKFVGWESCIDTSRGVRILVKDTYPHTLGLGTELDGRRSGVVLNFTFEKYSPDCKTRPHDCVRRYAVHEFGHVLGFAHEHARADAPADCRERFAETNVDVFVGSPYDPNSVMNYCNPEWYNAGKLSEPDIVRLQAAYGTPTR